jgi:hypothetical protein
MDSFNGNDDVEHQLCDLPIVSVDEVSAVMSDAVVEDFINDVVCNDNREREEAPKCTCESAHHVFVRIVHHLSRNIQVCWCVNKISFLI